MFLLVVEIAFILIATFFVFKTSQEYGRNALGWSALTIVSGFIMLVVSPFVIAICLALILEILRLIGLNIPLALVNYTSFFGGMIVTFGTVFLIMRYVSKMPKETLTPVSPPPPPPTTFN